MWSCLRSSNDFLEARTHSDCCFADGDGKYCSFNNSDHNSILQPYKLNPTLRLFRNFPVHDHLRIGPVWVSNSTLTFPISERFGRSHQSVTVPQVSRCPSVSPIFNLRTIFSIDCISILIIERSIAPEIANVSNCRTIPPLPTAVPLPLNLNAFTAMLIIFAKPAEQGPLVWPDQ